MTLYWHFAVKTRLFAVLVSLSLWLSGTPELLGQTNSPEGLWLSDGYGLLVRLDDSGLRTYELTSVSCIFRRTAKRTENRGAESAIIFMSGHETIRVIPTDDPNVLRMHTDGTASDIVLRRTSNEPDRCQSTPPNTPQESYAIFWQTFAEQYPFFAIHKTDWHIVDKKFRPQVTAGTKQIELFQILRQMIEPLQDSHTGLEARDINAEFDGWRNDSNHLEENNWKKASSITESKYVHGGLCPYCKGHIQFGIVGSTTGYLRVTTFYDYADVEGYAAEVQCLRKSLDTIFNGAKKSNGLVIDVRLNHGGDDPLGIEIASRLTEKKCLAYAKIARNNTDLDAPPHFTERQPSWVVPSARPGFLNHVPQRRKRPQFSLPRKSSETASGRARMLCYSLFLRQLWRFRLTCSQPCQTILPARRSLGGSSTRRIRAVHLTSRG